MDNLSHSLSGLAAGELVHRCLPREPEAGQQSLRRRLLLLSCLLSSNFPDLDLVLTGLLPPPLGYLLHHRGHTHTFLYALPQGLLLAALLWMLWPSARGLLAKSRTARFGFAMAIAAGLGLHIMMDYLNSYGIHPFYPFDSNWYFGDMVFIIEPFFWIAFGIPLAMTARAPWLRGMVVAALAGIILHFTIQDYLSWTSFVLLITAGAVLAIAQQRSGRDGKAGLLGAIVASLLFVGVQNVASVRARETVTAELQRLNPSARVLDAAMTSFPSNPLCWMFASVELEGDRYRTRRGIATIAAHWLPAAECPAPLAALPSQPAPSGSVVLVFEQQGQRDLVRQLFAHNCHFHAWMRFARIPSLEGGQATDIRFQISPRGNFTTIDLDAMERKTCPRHVPGWGFPRADLLGPG